MSVLGRILPAPALAAVAIAIKLTSRGPMFFLDDWRRVGLAGLPLMQPCTTVRDGTERHGRLA